MSAAEVARRWQAFADHEAPVRSPHYAALAGAVAQDEAVLGFLSALPRPKWQPNLLLGVLRLLHGCPPGDGAELHAWVLDDADRVREEVLTRSTQTNEPARCAALLRALADLAGPLALIEVGASAGLCLYPDRYAYDYRPGGLLGTADLVLPCAVTGEPPLPTVLPEVAVRVGIDLHPLDPVADADWLRALVWPGPQHDERVARLTAAAAIAGREPAETVTGDLLEVLPGVVVGLPAGVTPVVFHTAVLTYLPRAGRSAFVELVRSLPVRWISQEGPQVFAEVEVPPHPASDERFLLAVDGRPVAWTAPHGGSLDWVAGRS